MGISKIARSIGSQELDSRIGKVVEGYVVGTSDEYSSELLRGQTSDEGLPFGLEQCESVGHYAEDGSGPGAERWEERESEMIINARPEPNEVVRWEQEE